MGKVKGGPRYGTMGTVRHTFTGRAVVDMGLAGTWHIPYHLLSVPGASGQAPPSVDIFLNAS